MMAKPMKTLKLHYPTIQFLIINNYSLKGKWIFSNVHEPEGNNCFSIITQVTIEIPKLKNIKFYHNCC